MKYNQINKTIFEICHDNSLNFIAKSTEIEKRLNTCNDAEILLHIDHAGVIPECFDHDSTEEKVFAKYCDSLLARAFRIIGLDAHTIPERSDAADVIAKQDQHTIVGDAKAFRLSRTAKNQKDFKVEALDKWRKGADYACLVSPLYQYPNSNSQIYEQAIRYNVTLLSYTHLAFIIRNKTALQRNDGLKELWDTPKSLTATKSAYTYWNTIDTKILQLLNKTSAEWKSFIDEQIKILPEKAKEQIAFWEEEKQRIGGLSHDKAVEELLKALKINAKIEIIKRTAGL
ncbi:MAG: HindIII family type II restriction endonuclease [Candidatus Omnitrophota bacterium]